MFLGERLSHRPAAAHILEHIPGHRFPNQLSTNLLQLWQNPTVYRAHSFNVGLVRPNPHPSRRDG
jgi:hypothetical protein